MHIAAVSGPPEFNRMETKSKITAGVVIAAGALTGAAAVTNGPVYETPGYLCHLVERYDCWGNIRVIRVCDN